MKRYFVFIMLMISMLFCASTPVSAQADWVTMQETAKAIYQTDKQTVKLIGEDTDKSVELWLKITEKDQPDFYSLVHFLVRENGLTYMTKEYTKYASSSGAVISSADLSSKGWGPLPQESPIGRIAQRLFAEYRENQANIKAAAAISAIKVDPQELQKELEDERIKEKIDKDGTKNFHVHDSKRPTLFSGISQSVITDFCLAVYTNNNRAATLKFNIEDSLSGSHGIKEAVTLLVDGKQWVLGPPLSSTSGGYNSVSFKMVFKMPDALVSALVAAKNPITIKWKYRYGNNWGDHERVIPDKVLHSIQLMYAGCK